MFSVEFKGPVVVNAEELAALLDLTHAQVVVSPCLGDAVPVKRGRKPNGTNGHVPEANGAAPAQVDNSAPAPVAAAPKKRGRKSNAEKAAEAAAAAAAAGSPSADATNAQKQEEAPVNTDLLERFTSLVDSDYDKAVELLSGFGIARFNDLAADQHEGFSKALHSLGM